MEIKNFFATNGSGDIMPSALVYVYNTGTTTLATGLRDISNNALANPFTSLANGLIQFQAPNAAYDVRVVKGARDYTLRGIQCADLVTVLEQTASLLGAHDTAPTTRNDGTPLQGGDTYFNNSDTYQYYWDGVTWVINNVNGADIANKVDPSKGAALVGFDDDTVAEALKFAKVMPNYAALRAYDGLALCVTISDAKTYGLFMRSVATSPVDNGWGRIVDAAGNAWDRLKQNPLNLSWFEVAGNGVANDAPLIDKWLKVLGDAGGQGIIEGGNYLMASGALTQLNASFEVACSPNAKFIAASGFPSLGEKIIGIATGTKTNAVFKWVGGSFDSFNQPYDPAYANDTFSVNAQNCRICHVEIDRVYSGDDWLVSGSDSHLFIGGPSHIFARLYDSVGAKDTGIYISRNFAGTSGEFADINGNFTKCNGAVIVKRRFETGKFFATVVDCVTGVSAGTADIAGFASANAGHGFQVGVNAKRVEHPLFLNAASCVQGFVNAEQMGVSITGYTSPSASAARFRGAQGCQIDVNVRGMNPAISATVDFVGAFFGPITTALDGTLNATGNLVTVNCSGIGAAFVESGAGTALNTVVGKQESMVSYFPTVVGATTKYKLQRSNLEYQTGGKRFTNNSGQTLFSVNEDGSLSVGAQNAGSASVINIDFWNGLAVRAARILVSNGGAVADSGDLQINSINTILNSSSTRCAGGFRPGQFTLATLPVAANFSGYEIDVTDATGGPKRCRSDGTAWKILNTTTTVS